ncbi:Phosphatidylglycerol/phosphatidylinositol transfer protein [Podila minutissima]|nr:Phosphatidylglycerol/phosphatidylinositol transfer protein [Podila minutissima]
MKITSAVATVLALAASASAAFSSCGSASDDFAFGSVSYLPNPPKVNQQLCITLKGTLKKEVTAGASLRVSATFWGMNVYDSTIDLCASLVGGANPCPIPTTTTEVTQCITVPSNVPAGVSLGIKAEAKRSTGERIFCISGPITFSN